MPAIDWASVRIRNSRWEWIVREAGRQTTRTGKPVSGADIVEQALELYKKHIEYLEEMEMKSAFLKTFVKDASA